MVNKFIFQVPSLFSSSGNWLPPKSDYFKCIVLVQLNPLNAELNPISYLLALLAQNFLHVSRIRVKSLTLTLLTSYIYIYMERIFLMFLDHTQ